MENREILFRAKHVHAFDQNEHLNGKWVYGYLSDKNYINSFEEDEYGGKYTCDMLIDPETVCQFTGLYDNAKWESLSEAEKREFLLEWNHKENRKNTKEDWRGRRIFEGDIVREFADCSESGKNLYYFLEIVWNKELAMFEGADIYSKDTFPLFDLADIEIIGNVFDNPELLGAD